METRNVFLDSTEFIGNSFNFKSKKLLGLLEKSRNGSVDIYTTDVVQRELIHRISVHAQEGLSEIRSFVEAKRLRTVKHLPPIKKIASVTLDELVSLSINEMEEYFRQANITVIPTKEVKSGDVLELYFDRKPPFGEGKKKSEFPDAITLVALKAWCEENSQSIYVVSNDNDVKSALALYEAFVEVQDLAAFLEIVTEQEQEELEDFIGTFKERFEKEIESDIKRVMAEHELYEIDYDISAEFNDFRVNSVDLHSLYVIDADRNRLTVDVKATAGYSARVEHHDYDTAAYDKEDSEYIFINEVSYTFEDKTEQKGFLDYQIDSFPPRDWTDIHLEGGRLEPEVIEIDVISIRNREEY